MDPLVNASVIGRLLEEISWDGPNVRAYRDGGRGRENVLTAEVLMPLSYLPRDAFFGEILRSAHGADQTRARAAAEMDLADITLLPDESELGPNRIIVQPDATLVTPNFFVMIEAKRIRRSSFQPEQLAREYLAVVKEAGTRTPLLLLLLGSPPPLTVTGHGRLELAEAVTVSLEQLLARTGDVPAPIDELESQLPHVLAWITWEEVRGIVATQALEFNDAPNGLDGTVRRLSTAVATAIDWHS